MISQKIQKALQGSSAIRAMFVEGNELPTQPRPRGLDEAAG